MGRICVVTGSASGIGAATASLLRRQGFRVIGSDLHDADIVADLATPDGRVALISGVSRLAGGRIDAVVANAGGGPPETSLSLNFFGAVATLGGLRPLLANSSAPRAVANFSIASLRSTPSKIIEKCLQMDEPGAIAAARTVFEQRRLGANETHRFPDTAQTPLDLYGLPSRHSSIGDGQARASSPMRWRSAFTIRLPRRTRSPTPDFAPPWPRSCRFAVPFRVGHMKRQPS